jgi:hypothetical protein
MHCSPDYRRRGAFVGWLLLVTPSDWDHGFREDVAGEVNESAQRAIKQFAQELADLRKAAGSPSFREMTKLNLKLPHTTSSDAVKGDRLPSLQVVYRFVDACKNYASKNQIPVNDDDFDRVKWHSRWDQVKQLSLGGAEQAEGSRDPARSSMGFRSSLGWLMVCEPAEQSAAEIADAIGASRASLTTNMRLLVVGGLVRRRTRPGQRTAYYSVDEDTWRRAVDHKLASLAAFRDIAADGLDLIGPDSERAGRIRAAHDTFDWLGKLFAGDSSASGFTETGRPKSRGDRA